MRKKLALLLIGLAKRLSPVESEVRLQEVEGYDALRLGNRFLLSKKEVRNYRKEHPEIKSFRGARKAAIEKVKGDIRLGIFKKIIEDGIIDFKVESGQGDEKYNTVISGYLNIYVPSSKEHKETDTSEAGA